MIDKDRISKDLKDTTQMRLATEKKLTNQLQSLRARNEDLDARLQKAIGDYQEVFD